MALPLLAAIGHEVIIAVAVEEVFLQQKTGDMVNTAQFVVPAKFRAVGPGLVAVHEQPFRRGHLPGQLGPDGFQRPGGQVCRQVQRTIPAGHGHAALPHTAGGLCGPTKHFTHAVPPRAAVR